MDGYDDPPNDPAPDAATGTQTEPERRQRALAFTSYDRRTHDSDGGDPDRRSRRPWSTLSRAVTIRELAFAAAAVLATVLGALGFSVGTPRKAVTTLNSRIDTDSSRVTFLETRVNNVSARVDTLYQKADFTNYLLCVQIRRTDPASTPPGCDPLIQTWRHP
jgi:hypothetical protein